MKLPERWFGVVGGHALSAVTNRCTPNPFQKGPLSFSKGASADGKGPVPNYAHAPADHDWPTGTNLFDAEQATAMVRYMLEGLPMANADLRELLATCRHRIKAQTDVGLLSEDPANEDPQHEFQELLVDLNDALGLSD